MSGLSEQEQESLETANYDAEGRGLGDGHPIFAAVEAIVARRVAAALEPVKALADEWHHPDHGGSCWGCAVDRALAAATETGGES